MTRDFPSPPPVFAAFDAIRVVNLAYRTDRRAEMLAQLRSVRLDRDPRVAFFDAIAPEEAGSFTSKGARGVYASHLQIIKEASRAGQSVLVLEDDCDFTDACSTYTLPVGCDVFYGGYTATSARDPHQSNIIGAHFMGFSQRAANRLASYLVDVLETEGHPPIDGAYVWFRRAHPEYTTIFADPVLGHQRASRTDIGGLSWFDRSDALRSVVSAARRVKRVFRR